MNVDTLIVGRGGGSIEDLWAFNEECVARAIYNSDIPVISAVGHETDFTIADYVADRRAPTPSAAAEISVPSAAELIRYISVSYARMHTAEEGRINAMYMQLDRLKPRDPQDKIDALNQKLDMNIQRAENAYKIRVGDRAGRLNELSGRLDALSPLKTLMRGYSIPIASDGRILRNCSEYTSGMDFTLKVHDGDVECIVK